MKAMLGIVGGGQLALMMCRAAREIGVLTKLLSPHADAPARWACDQFLQAEYDSFPVLQSFSRGCTAITIDHEHVPLETLRYLAALSPTAPTPETLARVQDRLAQRNFLADLGIPQVRFRPIDKGSAVRVAARAESFPGVLKRRTGGYDGHGQIRVRRAEDLAAAWDQLGSRPCVLEGWLEDIREFSLVGAVGRQGESHLYPPIANHHEHGQLIRSALPAELPTAAHQQAAHCWQQIAAALDYRGVLTVEFFLLPGGEVLVNEIAPRVHNSGHVTDFSFQHSQFEMHVRAVTGLDLAEPELIREGVMLNLYPQHGCEDTRIAARWEQQVGGRIILYGKQPRPGRKMGHWLLVPGQAPAALMKMGCHQGSAADNSKRTGVAA